MINSIFRILKNSYLGKRFLTLGYLPRWVIFIFDLFLTLFSSITTFFIMSGLTVTFYNQLNVTMRHTIILIVNALFFLVFRIYSGIIRHSTFIDGVKLLASTTSSFLVLIVVNYAYFHFYNTKIYLTTSLFICYVVTFLSLFLFRIMVKYIFEIYSQNYHDKKERVNTAIYGTDANAISVANALKIEIPSRFKLRVFIDKSSIKYSSNKRILNLPLINCKDSLLSIFNTFKIEALIITDKNLSQKEILAIVDQCLELDIKVFTVPVITDWENSNQIAKKITKFKIEDLLSRKPISLDNHAISNQLKGKTILITGAAGSIGSEITRQIIKFEPNKILVLDQAETPLHNLTLELHSLNNHVTVLSFLADIKDFSTLESIFKNYKPEIVYHAAAYKHVPLIEDNPAQAIFTNIIGTKNLADLSQNYSVEKFVMVSTDKAVNPSSIMGASKRIAEKYVQAMFSNNNIKCKGKCTKFITTRFGNVLGSNGSIVPLFAKQILDGGPLTITHPEIIRYFMTIPEACQLVLEAGAMGNGGEIFIFDMGQPVKIIDLATKMIRLAGFTPNKEIKIEVIGLRPGEKLYEELLNDNSKTLPTHNKKILIAQELIDDYLEIESQILDLENITKLQTNFEIVAKMKNIVPEFISMNSVYENLDEIIKNND